MQFKSNQKSIMAFVFAGILLLLGLLPDIAMAATRQNTYPIILVHGYRGYGRDENLGSLLGYGKFYWGGSVDIQQQLVYAGYETYTAAVGPYSSNWDRACELYAQIKGGKVDYGKAHSAKHGHNQFGKTYNSPFYSSWGSAVNGKVKKVHLLGHSQGGPTVRMLAQLLAQGSAEERTASGSSVSELFKGGKAWVHSVTTLASPHNGTDGADGLTVAQIQEGLRTGIEAFLIANPFIDCNWDLKLDQWGLARQPGESFLSYLYRVHSSPMWKGKDIALYDLGTNGSVQINRWVKAQSNVYYFSWATCASIKDPLSIINGYHIADLTLMSDKGIYNAEWWLQTAIIGSTHRSNNTSFEIPTIDKSWYPNDGYVNTISQNGPKWGSTDAIVNYNGTPQIGKWNFMGTKRMDHEDIIGRNWDGAASFFCEIAAMLSSLPVSN